MPPRRSRPCMRKRVSASVNRTPRTRAGHASGAAGCRSGSGQAARGSRPAPRRSMTAFIRGIWIPPSTTVTPASFNTVSNRPQNLPSRPGPGTAPGCRHPPADDKVPDRLGDPGCCRVRGHARIRIRQVACPMTASTNRRSPLRVTVWKKSHASSIMRLRGFRTWPLALIWDFTRLARTR